MPSRPKRKFESDEGPAGHAGSRPARRGDEGSRSVPTPETQDLYDSIRRIEEGLPLATRLQLQDGPVVNDEHAAYLQPPPHSQAPTSPRSPSCASTTHSLTRAFDDVAIEDEEHQNKKRRAMRHGPLDGLKRARAALMRKLGACPDCKARRVGCNHFDNTLFEQEYRRRRQNNLPTPVSPQPQEAPPPTSQPSFNNPAVDLVGSWQPQSLPPRHPSGNQRDAAQVEIDDLLRETPSGPTGPAAPYYFAEDHRLRLITNSFAPTDFFPQPTSNTDVFPMPPARPAGHRVPIGRAIALDVFECKHGDDGSSNPSGVCDQLFLSLSNLLQHFELMHAPYWEEYSMWKCTVLRYGDDGIGRVCGMLCEDDFPSCFECGGNRWEQWWYASISKTPSLTSGPSVRVGSQDGSSGWLPPSQLQYYGQGQGQGQASNHQMLWPGRYLGGNQSGSYYSCNESPAKARSSDQCFRPVHIYPQGCPLGTKCRSLQLQSQYTVKGPFLLILSALSLILMENWFMAGLFGNIEIVSAVLDTVRNHVFWISLLCVFVGLAGVWLFKHVIFRLGQGFQAPCDQRCLARKLFGDPRRRDVEDVVSIWDEDEVMRVLDDVGKSTTLMVR